MAEHPNWQLAAASIIRGEKMRPDGNTSKLAASRCVCYSQKKKRRF